jgi:chemotaxis signal transduction protein
VSTATRSLARRRHGGAGAADYLLFRVAGTRYGMRVASVREIVKSARVTAVPRAPETVLGITGFRGRIVTVIELARALGVGPASSPLPSDVPPRRPRILMVEVGAELVGFSVDEVLEVRRIGEEDVEPAQAALGADAPAHLIGVARAAEAARGESVLLLDPGGLLP